MRILLITIIIALFSYQLYSQNFEDLEFGTDSTFDVVTWNIEWFPKNGETTINYVTDIIKALNMDLVAIQEVDDTSSFNRVVDSLPGYIGYLESSYFAGLAYIYNSSTIEINDIYEIYTTSPYWKPFPRSPMVIDLNYNNERILVINNHFKCCGDGTLDTNDANDEEMRRKTASDLLKDYIDENLPNENVIVLGDLNDILTDDDDNNVFLEFINDSDNYKFVDMEIALSNSTEWSYPSWPSHLDHILITNELFDEFEHEFSEVKSIKIEDYMSGWSDYDQNISDHRPIAMKLKFDNSPNSIKNQANDFLVNSYPNPFSSTIAVIFHNAQSKKEISIRDIYGNRVFKTILPENENKFTWQPKNISNGIYIIETITNNNQFSQKKIIYQK